MQEAYVDFLGTWVHIAMIDVVHAAGVKEKKRYFNLAEYFFLP